MVRRNVEALRGSVTVSSEEGRRTTFTIRLPLSLAIIPGFAVTAGGETFIVPLEAVLECVELTATATSGRAQDESLVLSLRGQPLPCRRLRHELGALGEAPAREYVVVIQHAGRLLGLVVDTLLGENLTVLKPLGRLFRELPGIAGSAILGADGWPCVLDPAGLFREAA